DRVVSECRLQALRPRHRGEPDVAGRGCTPVPGACAGRLRAAAVHDRERLAVGDAAHDHGTLVRRRARRPRTAAVGGAGRGTGRQGASDIRHRSRPDAAMTARASRPALRLPDLSLGCAQLGNLYRAITDDVALATVDAAWELGIRYFDTAPHYGLGLSE